MWGFPKLGVLLGGPHNKEYSILGSILGFPYSGKLPNTEDRTCRASVSGSNRAFYNRLWVAMLTSG